jgi:TRAP-type C4-dicarboxylate transport system permease small subunit
MKLEKYLNSCISNFCAGLLLLIVGFTFLQVLLREFFDYGLLWVDEASRFCMVWMGLFGSIWVTNSNKHLNVGLKLHEKFDKRLVCLIDSIFALFIVIVAAVVAYQTAIFTSTSMNMASTSLSWLKMGYVFIAVPVAMLALAYYYLKSFFKNLHSLFKRD